MIAMKMIERIRNKCDLFFFGSVFGTGFGCMGSTGITVGSSHSAGRFEKPAHIALKIRLAGSKLPYRLFYYENPNFPWKFTL